MIEHVKKVGKSEYQKELDLAFEKNVYLKPIIFETYGFAKFEPNFIEFLKKSNYGVVRVYRYECGKKLLSVYTCKRLSVICESMGQALVMRMDRRASVQYRRLVYENVKNSQIVDGAAEYDDSLTIEDAHKLLDQHTKAFMKEMRRLVTSIPVAKRNFMKEVKIGQKNTS